MSFSQIVFSILISSKISIVLSVSKNKSSKILSSILEIDKFKLSLWCICIGFNFGVPNKSSLLIKNKFLFLLKYSDLIK